MALDIVDFIPDAQAVEDGVWLDLDEDTKVKVRYLSPDAYQNELVKRQRRVRNPKLLEHVGYLRGIENDLLRTCIMDWTGMRKGGKEFPFSQESLDFVIASGSEVRIMLLRIVQDVSNFTTKQREENEKNLPTASSGISLSNGGGEISGEQN